ncbi:MAG: hypothetical protein KIS66_01485 [Fimbriimonadaceae bacterium]|nr:hypothetical protein [Fimbriimonadaceae bacterium]
MSKRRLVACGLGGILVLVAVTWLQVAVAGPAKPAAKEVAVAFLRQIGAYKAGFEWTERAGGSSGRRVYQLVPGSRHAGSAPMIVVDQNEGIVVGYVAQPDYDGRSLAAAPEDAQRWRTRLGLPKDWRRLDVSDGYRLRGGKSTAFRLAEFPYGYEPFEESDGALIGLDSSTRLVVYSRAVGYRALPPPDKLLSVADGLRIVAKKRTDPKHEVRFHKTMYVVPNDRFGGQRRKNPKELVLARVYKLSDRKYLFLDAGDGKVLGGFEVSRRRSP